MINYFCQHLYFFFISASCSSIFIKPRSSYFPLTSVYQLTAFNLLVLDCPNTQKSKRYIDDCEQSLKITNKVKHFFLNFMYFSKNALYTLNVFDWLDMTDKWLQMTRSYNFHDSKKWLKRTGYIFHAFDMTDFIEIWLKELQI